MASSSGSTFIPKRDSRKRKRTNASHRVYLFTIISYTMTFVALLSAGAVTWYKYYVDQQLDQEIVALNQEIGSYSERDLQRVLAFDLRLQQAASRLENSASLTAIFRLLEEVVIDTVQLQNLTLERVGDQNFLLAAAWRTDSFDSTIFQRDAFAANQSINEIEILSVQRSSATSSNADGSPRSVFSVQSELSVPVSAVPYDPTRRIVAPLVITEPNLEATRGEADADVSTAGNDAADAAAAVSEQADDGNSSTP